MGYREKGRGYREARSKRKTGFNPAEILVNFEQ